MPNGKVVYIWWVPEDWAPLLVLQPESHCDSCDRCDTRDKESF